MSNQEFLSTASIVQSVATSHIIKKDLDSNECIKVTVMGDHLAYTGNYGNAILRMTGVKSILDVIGAHSNDEYLLSKVVTTDMTGDVYRQTLLCDTLRYLGDNH